MWSIIQAAGWPIWPLILASIVALALIFERLWSLRQSVVAPANMVDHVLAEFRQVVHTIGLSASLEKAVHGAKATANDDPVFTVGLVDQDATRTFPGAAAEVNLPCLVAGTIRIPAVGEPWQIVTPPVVASRN